MAQQSESVTDTEPVCKDCNLGFEDRDWNRLPLKYVPCHKRKYSFPKSERFQLNPGNIQAGKPGDPSKIANCVMVAPCTNEPLILPPEQQYIREFLTKVAKVIPSKVAKEMMVKEFGLFDYEADRLIKKLRTSPKKVATLNLDARECWLEEYKRLMSVKLTDYLATVMSARRTKRTRHIAATLLNHFCDLTGEYCNLNNPRNRVQRIQVYIADRIAIWLADIMAKIDKEMCKDYIEKVQNDLDSEENKIDESQEESKEESEKDKKPAKKTKTKPSNKSKKDAEKKKKKEEEDKVKKKEADKKKEDEKKKKEADKKKKEAEKKKKEADAKKEADEKKKEAENKKKESEKKKKEGEKKKEAAKKKEEKEKDEEKKKQEEEKKKKESEKIKEQKKKEEEKKKEEKKKEEKEEKKKEKEEEKKEEEKKEKTEKKNEPEKKKSEKKGSVKNEAEKKKEADKKKKPSENKKKETTKKKEAEKKKVADKKKEPEKKKKEPPKKKEGEEAKKAEEEDKKKDDEKPKEEVEKKEEDEKEIEKPKEEDKKAEGDKQEVEKPQEEEKKEVEKPKEEEKKKVEEPKEEEKKEEEKKEDEKKEVEEVPKPSDEAKKEDEKKEVEEVPKPADEAKKEDEKKVDEPIEEAKKEDAEEVKKPTEEDKKIELDEKTKDDEHGEGDGDVTQDPLDALETLIPVTKSAEALTPAEERVTEVIKDQIKHELGGDLTPQDEAALADISGKISSWVVDSLEKGKKELTERPPEGKVTYYISRPVGECYYNVRKIDDRQACAVAKSARLERVAVISESICKTPTNLMPAQSTKEMKEWAKWAANVVDLAEKWATWIDKTCDEAETKAKAGKEGNVEWEKFKRTTQSHAYELRRNKRFVKESAEAWKKKYSQIPR